MNKMLLIAAAAFALQAIPAARETSEITIGISITTTGPAAALGVPQRNALDFVPKEIAGVPLKVIVLDDGGDPTTATRCAALPQNPRPISSWDRRPRRRRLQSPMSPTKPVFRISASRRFR